MSSQKEQRPRLRLRRKPRSERLNSPPCSGTPLCRAGDETTAHHILEPTIISLYIPYASLRRECALRQNLGAGTGIQGVGGGAAVLALDRTGAAVGCCSLGLALALSPPLTRCRQLLSARGMRYSYECVPNGDAFRNTVTFTNATAPEQKAAQHAHDRPDHPPAAVS